MKPTTTGIIKPGVPMKKRTRWIAVGKLLIFNGTTSYIVSSPLWKTNQRIFVENIKNLQWGRVLFSLYIKNLVKPERATGLRWGELDNAVGYGTHGDKKRQEQESHQECSVWEKKLVAKNRSGLCVSVFFTWLSCFALMYGFVSYFVFRSRKICTGGWRQRFIEWYLTYISAVSVRQTTAGRSGQYSKPNQQMPLKSGKAEKKWWGG